MIVAWQIWLYYSTYGHYTYLSRCKVLDSIIHVRIYLCTTFMIAHSVWRIQCYVHLTTGLNEFISHAHHTEYGPFACMSQPESHWQSFTSCHHELAIYDNGNDTTSSQEIAILGSGILYRMEIASLFASLSLDYIKVELHNTYSYVSMIALGNRRTAWGNIQPPWRQLAAVQFGMLMTSLLERILLLAQVNHSWLCFSKLRFQSCC